MRYDDIYQMDEIKSLSFHIMFYCFYIVLSQNTLFPVIPVHHLSDCDLYMPPTTGREGETEAGGDENDQLGHNQELVPKRCTTSVAWSSVFKHCSFKTTDFKPLKINRAICVCRLFLCERSALFLFCRL